jgi:carbonic anhydrase
MYPRFFLSRLLQLSVLSVLPTLFTFAASDGHDHAHGDHGAKSDHGHSAPEGLSASESLIRLESGNKRYVSGLLTHPNQGGERRKELAGGQKPFAIILGCADSRATPEIIFDQGLGDLFVIRVAGNIVDNVGLGSIEYAVDHLGTKLIVVLGHENCGAVKAAREVVITRARVQAHIDTIVEEIKPAVLRTKAGDVDSTVWANIDDVVEKLSKSDPILRKKVKSGQIKVIGARYDLDTGLVEFRSPLSKH